METQRQLKYINSLQIRSITSNKRNEFNQNIKAINHKRIKLFLTICFYVEMAFVKGFQEIR